MIVRKFELNNKGDLYDLLRELFDEASDDVGTKATDTREPDKKPNLPPSGNSFLNKSKPTQAEMAQCVAYRNLVALLNCFHGEELSDTDKKIVEYVRDLVEQKIKRYV